MSDLATQKWVRVMADFSAEGLWAKDGSGCGACELPISDALKKRLRAWQDWFEDDCESYLPPEERNQPRDFNVAAFSAEGREIARAIKSELPDWTVIYFDEEKAEADNRNDGDRSAFEYQI